MTDMSTLDDALYGLYLAESMDQVEADKDGDVTPYQKYNPVALAEIATLTPTVPLPDLPRALCASPDLSVPPDAWHPEPHHDPHLAVVAKVICHACPERSACLAGALEREEDQGIWGGFDLAEGLCKARHQDWAVRKDGRRYCRSCDAARLRAARLARKAVAA